MIAIFMNPIYWTKAIKALSYNNDLDANIYLNKMNQNLVKNNYKYFMLRAFSYLMLKKYENAIIDCAKSLQILENKKYTLNDDEYKYLKKYIFYILCTSYRVLKNNNIKNCIKEFNILQYNQENISQNFLRLFPQSKEPYWQDIVRNKGSV